jgi:hypothetical protein
MNAFRGVAGRSGSSVDSMLRDDIINVIQNASGIYISCILSESKIPPYPAQGDRPTIYLITELKYIHQRMRYVGPGICNNN